MYSQSQKQYKLFFALLRVAAAVLMALALLPAPYAQAQDEDPPTSFTPPAGALDPTHTTFTLLLNVADAIQPDEIPTGLDTLNARQYSQDLMARYAQPVLRSLERLQFMGKVSGYEYDTRNGTIRVTGQENALAEQAAAGDIMQRISGVVPEGKEIPECAVDAVTALPVRVRGISQSRMHGEAADQESIDAAQGLSPSDPSGKIEVYMNPNWTYVRGRVAANAAVVMTIKRGATTIASVATKTYTDGFYYIYPDWHSCPTSGYTWVIKPGDVVSIVTGGVAYSTVAVNVKAQADPVTNVVSGGSAANRKVNIVLVQPTWTTPCNWVQTLRAATSSATGVFGITFGDFDGRAYSMVHVRDAAGNSSFVMVDAFHLYTYSDSTRFIYGSVRPGTALTVRHYRGATLLQTAAATSASDGWFYQYLNNDLKANDLVKVTGTGVNLSYSMPALVRAVLNPSTNVVSGFTSANRLVVANTRRSTQSFSITCFNSFISCGSAKSSSTGAFSIAVAGDVLPGDYSYMTIYDAAGNYYETRLATYTLAINRSYNQIAGTWGKTLSTPLAVKHYRGTTLLSTQSVYPSSYSGYFSYYYSSSELLKVNDVILVTDGTSTLKTAIKNVVARGKFGATTVTGAGPAGKMMVYVADFRPAEGMTYDYCKEATNTGTFSVAFPLAFGGYDYQDVSLLDAAGYYWIVYANTFTIGTVLGSGGAYGYVEAPGTPVTVTHRRGATTLGNFTRVANTDGYYYVGLGTAVQAGDTLIANNPATAMVKSMTAANLKVYEDPVNNRVYGTIYPNVPVFVWLGRYYGKYYNTTWWSVLTKANSAGAYSQSFNGRYYSYRCKPVLVGEYCARGAADYYNPSGFRTFVYTAWPYPVTNDIYEVDDTVATAKVYSAAQKHSLTNKSGVSDVDWVAVNILSTDLNKPITFKLSGLGWYMYVNTVLYDKNGTTTLYSTTLNDPYSTFTYTFTTAGKYYLKFSAGDSDSFGGCDSYYILTVVK